MGIVPKRLSLRILGAYFRAPKRARSDARQMTAGHSFLINRRRAAEAAANNFAPYYGASIPISVRMTIHRRASRSFPDLADAARWFVELYRGRLWFSKPKIVAFSVELVTKGEREWIDLEIERTDI